MISGLTPSVMELKHQLVIWKRAPYLQDNIALSPKLCANVVDEGIVTAGMMKEIMSLEYHTERVLKLISSLGRHGNNVFERFLRALQNSDHHAVAADLKKTDKFTKWGEMLPPSFTYFLDLSDFLKKYPHIALKLGEEGKHMLQTFIEGKLEVEHRKREELIKRLENNSVGLNDRMAEMKDEVQLYKDQKVLAEQKLQESKERFDTLKSSVGELEDTIKAQRVELQRLKHLFKQQRELDDSLEQQLKGLTAAEKPKATPRGDDLIVFTVPSSGILPSISDGRALVEGQDNIGPVELMRVRLLESQVHLHVIKLNLIRNSLEHLKGEDKKLRQLIQSVGGARSLNKERSQSFRASRDHMKERSQSFRASRDRNNTNKPETDPKLKSELKNFANELQQVRKHLENQLKAGEEELLAKEDELAEKEREMNMNTTIPDDAYTELTGKLHSVIEKLRSENGRKLQTAQDKHDREVDAMIVRIQEMNVRHAEDVDKLRMRVRQKMTEIHKREQLHKRLRHQITVLERYHAKNMNATISVEQCRKVVRGIIGDARKLKEIADEKDQEVKEEEAEGQNQAQGQGQGEGQNKNQQQTQSQTPSKPEKKKKKKRRRKHADALVDDKLRYVIDKICPDWRKLGHGLGMTENRMDMIEMDTVGGAAGKVGLNMLRIWRDEDDGKVTELMEALQGMGRDDLAAVVIPASYLREARTNKQVDTTDNEWEPAAAATDNNTVFNKTTVLPGITA